MYSSSDVHTTKSVESSFSTDQNVCYIRHKACIFVEVGCIQNIILRYCRCSVYRITTSVMIS